MHEITEWLYLFRDLDHWMAREWINGLWFSVSLCVLIVFVAYLIRAVRVPGWYDHGGVRAAIALTCYFAGETLVRGWIWLLLVFRDIDSATGRYIREDYWIMLIAALLSISGALYCIHVFSRSKWALIWSALFVTVFIIAQITIYR